MPTLDLQPTLQSELLTLRPLREEDYENLLIIAADPLLWAQHPDPARSTKAGFDAFFSSAMESGSCLVAIDTKRDRTIGCSRYHSYIPGHSVVIGFTFVSRAYWGGFANSEMKKLMLNYAFSDVREVRFLVADGNTRSRRAVEKLGAVMTGAETEPRFGQVHLIYRLTPSDWVERTCRPAVTRRNHGVEPSVSGPLDAD